jgi:hypothetical protein
MIKHILSLILILTMTFTKSTGQLKLPKGFNCVLGVNHINESYFTDGTFSFSAYPWGHEGISGQDVVDIVEENYKHKIKFKLTKDNLYWATGKLDGNFVYIVIVDGTLQFTLSSKTNNSQFSNYSAWMLQQIRNNIASNTDNDFVDYKGKSCSGIR